MSDLKPVSKELFEGKAWLNPASYSFAVKDTVIGLGINEYAKAMVHVALGFVESAGSYSLVAIQGFEQGQNLFVGEDGRWMGTYIPQFYQFYPFRLAQKDDAETILCVDEASGLIVDAGVSGSEKVFFKDGVPTNEVRELFSAMLHYENEVESARKVCALIADLDLIDPWPVTINKADGDVQINGFFRINETKLNTLSNEELARLRNEGGLALCYAQLFSMQKIMVLGELAVDSSFVENASSKVLTDKQYLDFFNNDEAISFDNL